MWIVLFFNYKFNEKNLYIVNDREEKNNIFYALYVIPHPLFRVSIKLSAKSIKLNKGQ